MNRKTLIVTGSVIVILSVLAFLFYHFFIFHLTKTSPSSREFPSFARYVDFYFSHPIKSVGSVHLNGEQVYGQVQIKGNWARYSHIESFPVDAISTLKLNEVTSTGGERIDVEFRFTPRYIEFNDLPEDVRRQSIEKASSGQKDDPFFNNYFPMIEDEFQIEYRQNPVTLESVLYVTFLAEVYDYDTGQQIRLPDTEAERLRDTVFAHIRNQGGTPEKYDIHYDNIYLEVKYGEGEETHGDEAAN